jgi:hypothetical protein
MAGKLLRRVYVTADSLEAYDGPGRSEFRWREETDRPGAVAKPRSITVLQYEYKRG